jgi:ABC-type phosphate transport system permease subunit
MIRFVLRSLGFILLAVAAMFAVIDGTKSIAKEHLTFTSFGDAWKDIHPASLEAAQKTLEGIAPVLWSPLTTTVLWLPASIVIALMAFIFLQLGSAGRKAYL